MKYFFLFCVLFLSTIGSAQSLNFLFKGTVTNSDLGKNEVGVTVSIDQNGSTISSATTASNGKYTLKGNVNYSKPFSVVFSKSGMVSKKVNFNFVGLNEEDVPAGSEYQPVTDLSMNMFAVRPNTDFSFLDSEPVAAFNWEPTKAVADLDRDASSKMKAKIDKLLLQSEANKAADEAKYQAAIAAADGFYAQKKYEQALAKYEEAVSVKPKEPHPNARIIELDALIQAKKKEDLENQQADSEYLNLIKAADLLRDQKKYDLAVAKYKEAINIKDEQYPKDQVKELENQAKYQEAITAADMFYNQKSYQMAKEKYTIAKNLKPSEQYPVTRLADIEKKLVEKNADDLKKKKYDDAVAAADQLFTEEKWAESKAKYTEAITFEAGATYPIERIKECDLKIAAIAKDKEKADKIIKLLADGSTFLGANKLVEAKGKYTEVLGLDSENAEAKLKLEEIDKKIEEAGNAAAQEAKFKKLVGDGDLATTALKYTDAKSKYEEALLIKADAAVQTKLDNVNKKIADAAALIEKKEKYAASFAEAETLFKAENWEEAKKKYTEALTYNEAEVLPKEKIKVCDAKLALLVKDKEKTEKIAKLLAEGSALMTTEKWSDAKLKFNEVLLIEPVNAEAKQKNAEIDLKLKELANQADLDAKFNKLVAEGDLAVKNLKYPEAKSKFEAALLLKPNAEVQSKLDDVNKKMNDLLDKEASEVKFLALKTEGMKLATEQDFTNAKTKLNEALAIHADAAISAKIKEIDLKLAADEAALKLAKEYDDLMAAAQSKVGANDLDGAIAKYKEASLKKPNEQLPKDKIIELEGLKLNSTKQKEIDLKYAAFLKKGDDLMAQKKYLEAIKEFNEALALKPTEVEPRDKAAEAERLEKAKGSEGDVQYEKILTVAQTKIDEKDYVKARELADRALKGRPTDPRPKALIDKINLLEKQAKDYAAKMIEAEKLASAKDYQKAVAAFEQAKVIKGDETKPQIRIDELNIIIQNQSSLAEKEALYKDYMTKGALSQTAKAYEQALSHYQNALSVKPNDQPAKDKIAELQQILDDIANSIKNGIDKKNQFDALVALADNSFGGQEYLNAKSDYQKALAIDATSDYVKKQIEECERLQRLKDLSAADSEYAKIINDADEAFNIKSYDKAKENYQRAVDMRAKDQYPKDRLKEIDFILNPVITKSSPLEDLGDPFDNSIIDGYAALMKADLERKNNNTSAVKNQFDEITLAENELSNQKVLDQQETTDGITLLKNTIGENDANADIGRQDNVELLHKANREIDAMAAENGSYEHSENLKSQETLNVIVDENAIDYGIRDGVYAENTEIIHNVNKSLAESEAAKSEIKHTDNLSSQKELNTIVEANAIDYGIRDGVYAENTSQLEAYKIRHEAGLNVQGEKETGSNISADQQLIVINKAHELEDLENYDAKKGTENEVRAVIQKSEAVSNEISDSKQLDLLAAKAAIEKEDIIVSEKAENDSHIAKENEEELKVVKNAVIEIDKVQSENQRENSTDLNASIVEINKSIEESNVTRDLDRLATTETLYQGNISIDKIAFDTYNKETEKYLQNKNLINVQTNVNTGIAEVADAKQALNVSEVEMLDKKATTVSDENSMSDEKQRMDARATVTVMATHTEEVGAVSSEKQKENASSMDDVNKSLNQSNTNKETAEKIKHNDAQTQLDGIDRDQPKKVKLANGLGQDYPEGVSQESFTQSDENGLMTAIITRRVVVINGNGAVYVRTQTLDAITYSKNGEPTTEYTWQKETQGPNLEKHY